MSGNHDASPATLNIALKSGVEDAAASFSSLLSVFEEGMLGSDPAHRFAELVRGFIDRTNDGANLFRCEFVSSATGGALEQISLKILPSQAFLELVSAIAVEREDVSFVVRHGWPILSVVSAQPTVTGAGGESIPARKGGAA